MHPLTKIMKSLQSIQDKDLQQKQLPQSFNLNMSAIFLAFLSAILDGNHYQKSQKWHLWLYH